MKMLVMRLSPFIQVRGIGLGLVLAVGMTLPAAAANFFQLSNGNANVDAVALWGLTAVGDRAVGSAAPGSSEDLSPVSYSEDAQLLQDISFLQPSGATGLEATARGQQLSANGSVRWTVGHITEGPVAARNVFVVPQGAGPSTFLPKFPVPLSVMTSLGIGRNGNLIGRTVFQGTSEFFFHNQTSSTFTMLNGMDARAIDARGRRVVGRLHANATHPSGQAMLWEEGAGATGLGSLVLGGFSEAHGISAAGRIVVGTSQSPNLPPGELEAFRWHPDFGMHALEPIVGGAPRESVALASSDANSVVGSYNDNGTKRAFIWTPVVGRMDMEQYLDERHGLASKIQGWTLTEATHISADGTIIGGRGVNPQGLEDSWIADLTDEDVAELRFDPLSPNQYRIILECGDTPIRELYFGLIFPQAMSIDDPFNFGGCTDDTINDGDLFCTGANVGPTVAETSFVTVPDGVSAGTKRGDTLYVQLVGAGGSQGLTLCDPGDPVAFIADFFIDEPVPQLVFNPRAGGVGIDPAGLPLPESSIRLIGQPDGTETRVFIRPAVGDLTGTQYSVSMSSELAISRFSFGLTMPPNASALSFGDCTVDLGPSRRRGCANGAELGSSIDFQSIRTIGPAEDLPTFGGLRADSIYVYLEGNLEAGETLGAINVPGNQVLLGYFTFDEPPPPGFGFVPTPHFEQIQNLDQAWGGEVNDWTETDGGDVQSISLFSSAGYGGGEDPDLDLDGIENADDRCPYVSSAGNADNGTLEQPFTPSLAANIADGIGNECQCGDAIESDTVITPDIDLLRDALNDPGVAASISPEALAKCNAIGPVIGVIDPATQLPIDCNLNDVFALIKGRLGAGPLIESPGDFPVCPDAMTP